VFPSGRAARLLAPDVAAGIDPHAFGQRCYDEAAGGLLERLSAIDLQTYLAELLTKQDRMSMAASIESRVPFLDDRLVRLVASLPARVKLRGWQTKAVLRRAVRDRLPRVVLTRRKMGFPVPLTRWFRGAHRPIVDEFVTGPRALERGLFDPAAVRALAGEHQSGASNHAERLWLLVNLEIWQRLFCDGEAPADVMRPVREHGRHHASHVGQGGRTVAAQHGRAPAHVRNPFRVVGGA
jgi:asparagine synthase (glutamine-hydrolysing)